MDDDKLFDESDEKPKIKVTDRRKFTADGNLRPSEAEPAAPTGARSEPSAGPASEAAAPSAAAEPAPNAEPEDAAPAGADSDGAGLAGEAARPGGPTPSIAGLPRDFTAFVEGMYLEAMLYLGALPDPRTGDSAEDLDMAKYKIDLLGMIQEKTRGNLSAEETQQLEDVLYQLRMFYVQRSKGDAQ